MLKTSIIMSLFAISIFLGGCFGKTDSTQPPTATDTAPPPAAQAPSPAPSPAPTDGESDLEVNAGLQMQIIALDSGNLYFKPSALKVKVNQPVTVNYTNKGTHSFVVSELGLDVPLTAATGSFTFTPRKVGTFPIICGVPGHKEAGMSGKIVVE